MTLRPVIRYPIKIARPSWTGADERADSSWSDQSWREKWQVEVCVGVGGGINRWLLDCNKAHRRVSLKRNWTMWTCGWDATSRPGHSAASMSSVCGVDGGGIKAREEEKNDRKGALPRKKTQNLTGRLHFSAAARPVYGCLASTGGSSLTTCVGEGWRFIAHKGKKKKKGGGRSPCLLLSTERRDDDAHLHALLHFETADRRTCFI